MNFDKESTSEKKKMRMGVGVEGTLKPKQYDRLSREGKYKTATIYTMYTGKRHNSANVLRNSVKGHLNVDPKQSSEFQDPSSSNSLHIVLTRFFYFYKS